MNGRIREPGSSPSGSRTEKRHSPAKPVRAALIGAGHLGQHHARLYASSPWAELVAVADVLPQRALQIASRHGAEAVEDFRSLFGRIDVASVAVPTVLHAAIASELMEQGIDVLVEKPVAASLEQADALISLARDKKRILMVGHTERFNPAVEALSARARDVRFVEAHRLGSFSERSVDIDVVLDLMIHDLDVILALTGDRVVSVDAIGIGALTPKVDIANARVRFASGCVANLTASRISAQKVRKLRVWETGRYFSLDYSEQMVEHWFLKEGEGDRPAIGRDTLPVEKDEPLKREIEEFLGACRSRSRPRVSGEDGRRALEAALLVLESIGQVAPIRA